MRLVWNIHEMPINFNKSNYNIDYLSLFADDDTIADLYAVVVVNYKSFTKFCSRTYWWVQFQFCALSQSALNYQSRNLFLFPATNTQVLQNTVASGQFPEFIYSDRVHKLHIPI